MWILTPVVTVSYAVKGVFLFLSVLEFAAGILINTFIFLVNFRDVVRRQPLSDCDLVLLILSLTRLFLHGLLFLDALQLTLFHQMKDPLSSSYQTITMLWMIANQAGLWLTTCLSLLYCSKIVRSSHGFLLSLASWVSRRKSRMLLGTVLFTCVCTGICSWDFFSRSHITATFTLSTNYTEHNLQTEKLGFFQSFLFCSLGSIPPFLCFLASSGVLIVSLRRHMGTMRAKTSDSLHPSLEAHIKALKSLISFLGVYMVSFCTALLSMLLLALWHNKLGVMVCVGVMAACPLGHAAILISGNAKLRRAVDSIFLWAQSSLKYLCHIWRPDYPDLITQMESNFSFLIFFKTLYKIARLVIDSESHCSKCKCDSCPGISASHSHPSPPGPDSSGLLSSFMNWHMIISVLTMVVLKIAGMTLFLLYFPWIFGESKDSLSPTRSYGTVPQIFGNGKASFTPTESSGTVFLVCPRMWDFHQGRCFFFFTFEMPWNKSRAICEAQGSTLAIVNTPEKLKFLQDIAGAEKYFIGLQYQQAEKRWRWIDNSIFNGNVTNQLQNFNCVTVGLTKTFDAALCDTPHRWICDKPAK